MSAETESSAENKLVQPRGEFSAVLRHAGATKDILTMKEVMFYLGEYIIKKQLFDQKQQHIVHCAQDPLGRVLGVDSFSVKEPRVLFPMITKNLEVVRTPDPASTSQNQNIQPTRSSETVESGRRRRRRSHRSSEPGPSHSVEESEDPEARKRRRSDSYSLTFDGSLSWCVIGGLDRDRHSSQSSDSTAERSEVAASDSDSDNFSVEFEVESINSDDYDEDDASLSADDQVYEVTIFEADEDDDSFDDDTEITEADYWRCGKCDELNPPLPRNCLRCWTLRQDWLPDMSACNPAPKTLPTKPVSQSAAGSEQDEHNDEGLDVPDGKKTKTPSESHDLLPNSQPSSGDSQPSSGDSQPSSSDSQPSSSDSQEVAPPVSELERSVSAEWRLPDSCLDPCLICQSRPKNGCIIHGRTGHLMSCYTCARKLHKRNKLCPVCRLPIQSVVRTYIS